MIFSFHVKINNFKVLTDNKLVAGETRKSCWFRREKRKLDRGHRTRKCRKVAVIVITEGLLYATTADSAGSAASSSRAGRKGHDGTIIRTSSAAAALGPLSRLMGGGLGRPLSRARGQAADLGGSSHTAVGLRVAGKGTSSEAVDGGNSRQPTTAVHTVKSYRSHCRIHRHGVKCGASDRPRSNNFRIRATSARRSRDHDDLPDFRRKFCETKHRLFKSYANDITPWAVAHCRNCGGATHCVSDF